MTTFTTENNCNSTQINKTLTVARFHNLLALKSLEAFTISCVGDAEKFMQSCEMINNSKRSSGPAQTADRLTGVKTINANTEKNI